MKPTTYKKIILAFFALSMATATLFSFYACDRTTTLEQSCIRIHIRANSNSEADQTVKLKVRDEITAYLTEYLQGCRTKSEAAEALRNGSEKMTEIANRVLYANNFAYKASVRLNNEHFPEKMYGDFVFPEGDYDAVIIMLGEGKGDNWWCVAFPPLCFLPNGNGEKVVYKSWVKEMLDKLF